jgi:hypothetical protein
MLEYELLWGPHGYNDMVRRLITRRPFQGLYETLQLFMLPLRYCTTMGLKIHAAHVQNALRLTHESHRAALEELARGSGNSLFSKIVNNGNMH